MGDNAHFVEKKQIRSSQSVWADLERLAQYRNTDLTGYINAVVFHDHLHDPENAALLESIKSAKPKI